MRFRQYVFGTLAFLFISFAFFMVLPLEERAPSGVDSSTGINLTLFSSGDSRAGTLALGAMTLVIGLFFAVLAWRNGVGADYRAKYGDGNIEYITSNDG